MAENPLPSMLTTSPWWTMRWSGHASISEVKAAKVPGSSASRNSNARSEKTRPKPKVESGGLRSMTRTSYASWRLFMRSAK